MYDTCIATQHYVSVNCKLAYPNNIVFRLRLSNEHNMKSQNRQLLICFALHEIKEKIELIFYLLQY